MESERDARLGGKTGAGNDACLLEATNNGGGLFNTPSDVYLLVVDFDGCSGQRLHRQKTDACPLLATKRLPARKHL